MSASASVDIRIECGLPPLPTITILLPTIFFIIRWPPTISLNLSLTIKCPELPSDWIKNLNEMLTFKIPSPRIPPCPDLTKYSKSFGVSETFDWSDVKDPHWGEPVVW